MVFLGARITPHNSKDVIEFGLDHVGKEWREGILLVHYVADVIAQMSLALELKSR